VKHIVVLGHAQCGGIRAFAEEAAPLSPGDFIGNWMAMIAPAAKTVGPRGDGPLEGYLTKLEQASAVKTIDNLMTFPWVKMLAGSGRLALHAAYFGVATGTLSVYDRTGGTFRPVAAGQHAETFRAPRF
jgi:carbonic anhydrase